MPRRAPLDRIDALVDAATAVFIAQGYRRTQMADVAAALGLAKGTLYLYVESKEALFDLVVRYADGPRPIPTPRRLPIPTPKAGVTLRYVRDELAREQVPALQAALGARKTPPSARDEVKTIARELFRLLARNRRRVKLADRAALDWPELAELWFTSARGGLMDLLATYLADRSRRRVLRPVSHPGVVARLVIETVVFWAVHRHWDPHPQPVDDAVAEATVVDFIANALVKE